MSINVSQFCSSKVVNVLAACVSALPRTEEKMVANQHGSTETCGRSLAPLVEQNLGFTLRGEKRSNAHSTSTRVSKLNQTASARGCAAERATSSALAILGKIVA